MTMQPGRVIEERETDLDLATFEGCLESLRARNLIFDHENPDTLLDVSGFDGVLARFVNLAFDREQCGTCARWRVMAHSFLYNDFDFPIGYIDALPVHNRLRVTFYADKPNEALNEFHRRMIEKVMRRVAEQETRPTVESAGPREQFKGTPAEFGVMVRNFNRQKPQPDKTFFVVTDPPDEKIPPHANPVHVRFGCFPNMDNYDCGWIVAQSLPGGKSELTAGAWAEDGWPKLEPIWNMLWGEMRQKGWLDAQPSQAGSTPARIEALARLRQQLVDSFSEEELKTVSFDLGIDYENLPAQGKAGKARELVAQCERTGRIPELVARCRKLRPNVSWEEVP